MGPSAREGAGPPISPFTVTIQVGGGTLSLFTIAFVPLGCPVPVTPRFISDHICPIPFILDRICPPWSVHDCVCPIQSHFSSVEVHNSWLHSSHLVHSWLCFRSPSVHLRSRLSHSVHLDRVLRPLVSFVIMFVPLGFLRSCSSSFAIAFVPLSLDRVPGPPWFIRDRVCPARFVWIAFQVPLSLFVMAFVPLCSWSCSKSPLVCLRSCLSPSVRLRSRFPTWFVCDRIPDPARFICDRVPGPTPGWFAFAFVPVSLFVIAFQVPLGSFAIAFRVLVGPIAIAIASLRMALTTPLVVQQLLLVTQHSTKIV